MWVRRYLTTCVVVSSLIAVSSQLSTPYGPIGCESSDAANKFSSSLSATSYQLSARQFLSDDSCPVGRVVAMMVLDGITLAEILPSFRLIIFDISWVGICLSRWPLFPLMLSWLETRAPPLPHFRQTQLDHILLLLTETHSFLDHIPSSILTSVSLSPLVSICFIDSYCFASVPHAALHAAQILTVRQMLDNSSYPFPRFLHLYRDVWEKLARLSVSQLSTASPSSTLHSVPRVPFECSIPTNLHLLHDAQSEDAVRDGDGSEFHVWRLSETWRYLQEVHGSMVSFSASDSLTLPAILGLDIPPPLSKLQGIPLICLSDVWSRNWKEALSISSTDPTLTVEPSHFSRYRTNAEALWPNGGEFCAASVGDISQWSGRSVGMWDMIVGWVKVISHRSLLLVDCGPGEPALPATFLIRCLAFSLRLLTLVQHISYLMIPPVLGGTCPRYL